MITKITCYSAAVNGHLEVLKWARSQKCPWDKDQCLLSAKGNVLEWIRCN